MSPGRISRREYDNLVREGINAAKAGNRSTARRLLFRAISRNPHDTLVWLWLSSTTDNLEERRELLEKAVASDPNNVAARTGLAYLNETDETAAPSQDGEPELAHGGAVGANSSRADPAPAGTQTFDCPSCGGRMAFDPGSGQIRCESCGHRRATPVEHVADSAETPMVGLLHKPGAHVWASAAHEVECENCGAHTLEEEPGQTRRCPYCGSNQLVQSKQLDELLDPQAIAVFRVMSEQAEKAARRWLNTGIFAPDGLADQARQLKLRPAYYPFWTFDGGVEIRWSAEVRENYSRRGAQQPEWRTVEGQSNEFFDDVLVPGVTALKNYEIDAILPFHLNDVIAFDPEQVAGWTTLAYDRSLADASLIAREKVVKKLTPRIRSGIEPGKERQHIRIGASSWSGVTYKHILLPIWVGTYQYDGASYNILVNGQTGAVGGRKPRDQIKVIGIWLLIFLSVAVLTLLLTWVFNSLGWF